MMSESPLPRQRRAKRTRTFPQRRLTLTARLAADGVNSQLIEAEKHPETVLKEVHDAYDAAADQASHQTKPIAVDRHALSSGQRHEDNVAPQAVSEERA